MALRVAWASRRGGVVIGAALAVIAAALHRSQGAAVLGLWSKTYAAILATYVLVVTTLVVWSFTRMEARRRQNRAMALFDLAILVWGAASLAAAIGDRAEASRVVDGVLFGSAVPLAVLLDGASIALFGAALCAWGWSHRGTAAANPLLAVATVLVLAVGCELALRVRAVVAPMTQGFPTYSSDLWMRRHVRLNQSGFRDDEHVVKSSACRLAVIGDSYAFGVGIDRPEDRLGERLARRLDTATAVHWESINASRGDSHTLQEMDFLRAVAPLRPDVVVLLYVFNDMDYITPVTVRRAVTEAPASVFQRLHPARILFYNSFVVQEAVVLGRLARAQAGGDHRSARDPYRDSALLHRHFADLAAFVALAKQAAGVVSIVPFDVSVSEGGYSKTRYARFVAAARRSGLPILSLEESFDGESFKQLTVNRYDGHPNAHANAIAAAALAGPLSAVIARPLLCGSSTRGAASPAGTGVP